MKRILVLHNKYQNIGGEDIAVENEIVFLKKFYNVETLFFKNELRNILDLKYLLFSNNKNSNLIDKINFALVKKKKFEIFYSN